MRKWSEKMGVDVDAILIYGVYGEGNTFRSDEDVCDEDFDDYGFVIKSEDMAKYNLEVIIDGYSNNFSILGVSLFDADKEKFIENIKTAEENFKELAEKYSIDLEEYKPAFSLDYYYW